MLGLCDNVCDNEDVIISQSEYISSSREKKVEKSTEDVLALFWLQ